MMAPNVANLKQKRETIKAKIERFKTYIEGFHEHPDTTQLHLRMQKIDQLWTEFDSIQSQIESAAPQDVEQSRERELFEKSYFESLAAASKHLQKTTEKINTNETSNSEVATGSTGVKLPTVRLPSFSGNYEDWQPYYEVFQSLIHNNDNLSDIQRFHYLRLSLQGEAAKTIESLQLTSANYTVAWRLLTERFENKRLIVQAHVRSLFEQQRLDHESPIALRGLVDNILKHVRALQAMKQPTESWDTLLVHLVTSRLDAKTLRAWELEATSGELPTMKQLTSFLQQRCQMLEAVSANEDSAKNIRSRNRPQINKTFVHITTSESRCKICGSTHPLYQCETFLNKSVDDRVNEVKRLRLCFNCLKSGHLTKQCKSGCCKVCKNKHNTLLHPAQLCTASPTPVQGNELHSRHSQLCASAQSFTPAALERGNSSAMCYKANQAKTSRIMLATAQVLVSDASSQLHPARALLDAGSQSNFITEQLASKLNLHKEHNQMTIGGIGSTTTGAQACVTASIKSRINAYSTTLQFIVLPTITQDLPTVVADTSQWAIPDHIQLADPEFNSPQRIDLLLGAEVFFDLLCIGQLRPLCGYPTLQKTTLGWIISGRINTPSHDTTAAKTMCHLSSIKQLNEQVNKFWELENCTVEATRTPMENECEEHYNRTTTRNKDGRFIVRLPFKESAESLGDSKDIAVSRYQSIERRLAKAQEKGDAYRAFMKEYEELGHMSRVSDEPLNSTNKVCYLPHHYVIKEDSTTTKLRVVFDASAKTTSGVSLNDILMIGPTIQDDLLSIILRFRQHQYTITADIEKMYRQVQMHPDDASLQRIVWRESPSGKLNHYQLDTVTYGTACAPYLATRCIKQLALQDKDYPRAASTVMHDFYVDDLLTGGDSLEEVLSLRDQITIILQRGCFDLRKWRSNDSRLLPQSCAEGKESREINNEQATKSLGLLWNSGQDNFHFYVQSPNNQHVTKRVILSTVSRIFDPLGLLGPVIVKAKILLQGLWTLKLGWDESIPTALYTVWMQFSQQLPDLQKLKIPRKVIIAKDAAMELHGFCDASTAAYGACIYEVSWSGDTVQSRLLCSRSRVAPTRQITLPRLELCAALLLARLITKVMSSIHRECRHVTLWSDSTIVLAWLKGPAAQWKTFVANRVSEIQQLTHAYQWRHVKTDDNSADLISRGCMSSQIQHAYSWWSGPKFLTDFNKQIELSEPEECLNPPEQKLSAYTFIASESIPLIDRCSSLLKLQRVTAYCSRFIHNCRVPAASRLSGPLSVSELHQALFYWIKVAQSEEFHAELKALKNSGQLSPGSKLKALCPFLDGISVLRVGGRLENSDLPYDHKHPIILPAKHKLTMLIAVSEHERQLHAGPTLLLASLRQRFWPLGGRKLVRRVVHQCITCFRARPRMANQLMGQLPKQRVEPMRAFLHTGIDYCGPVLIRESHRRGNRPVKAYIAIFVCLSTKAVHIELVGDLTSMAFLGALRRFISRRGHCTCLYSDNGSTFVGANRELKELRELFQQETHRERLQAFLDKEQISWHFIPPYAPNFGGLWEAAVKSAKFHLKRIVANAMLTYEEMYTCLTQIEACLNSRPLTPMSEDPSDLQPLTPGHFLIGDPLTSVVEPDLQVVPFNRLSRWQHIQRLVQHFWSRWSREYLSELQKRVKWSNTSVNVSEGDMVLIKDDNSPSCAWHLGRIMTVHQGRDKLSRVFSIRTKAGIVQRTISKICPLPKNDGL